MSALLIDGGFSTALEQLGHNLNTSLWTGELLKSQRQQIRAAHQLFVDAGAEILITSSYQISYPGCAERGWSQSDADEALAASTELARFPGVKVAASIGPYGAFLADGSEYRGNYGLSEAALMDFHRTRLQNLITTNPDFLAIETIPELTEARALISLLSELNCDIPAWISFSCRSTTEISSGESFSEAVELVNQADRVFAIGANCTAPELVEPLIQHVESTKPFVLYPNSGRQWNAEKKEWMGPNESGFDPDMVKRWQAAGAFAIGGCCGVGPEGISELAQLMKQGRNAS